MILRLKQTNGVFKSKINRRTIQVIFSGDREHQIALKRTEIEALTPFPGRKILFHKGGVELLSILTPPKDRRKWYTEVLTAGKQNVKVPI